MPWSTRVPDTIDALVDAFRTGPELADVTVWDGPQVSKAAPKEMLTVAFTGDDTDSDVEATATPEGLGGGSDREAFTIRCAAAVLLGTTDMQAARRRAYELYSAAGAVIARDPRLGGKVIRARLGSHTFKQTQTPSGAQAIVIFGVDCDAFTRR
ncbi:hypothetical protein ACIQPQ_34350 [Streptomyces sp. NPDC091281]|uniref:hypothetical protein n=1 Tax=Streptomyces sp. NPDC091281 TaxID=3365985 RepID=UPI00381C1B2C